LPPALAGGQGQQNNSGFSRMIRLKPNLSGKIFPLAKASGKLKASGNLVEQVAIQESHKLSRHWLKVVRATQ
jgi:hypothetical protein